MHPSAKLYTRLTLRFYDIVVLWLSNNFIWRCSTKEILLPFFKRHIGCEAHMDVGVGTGYYLAQATKELSKTRTVCLVDLNPSTLETAGQRLREAGYTGGIDTLEHDVFKPLPDAMHGTFDAISMFYLLHCLPGAFPGKAERVLSNFVPALTTEGTLYGATVLGRVEHNTMGRLLVQAYNAKEVFGNLDDDMEGLEDALRCFFEEVDIKLHGAVAVFVARKPLRKS